MAKNSTDIINEINKKFGDGSIFKFSDRPNVEVEAFSTGILGLDSALGVGGIPRGRITEVIGQSGSGKTSVCLAAIADAQKKGYKCAIVDVEHALDTTHASLLGVNVDDLFVSQPDNGNDALSIVKMLIESGEFALVIIDSIAALTPMQEADQDDFGSANVGLHARLMSQAMRKLSPLVSKHDTALLMTNQLRCLDKQSLVMTDCGLKRLQSVKVNDKLLSLNNQFKKVLNIFDSGIVEGFRFNIRYNGYIDSSTNHIHRALTKNNPLGIDILATSLQKDDWLIFPINTFNYKRDYVSLESYFPERKISSYEKPIALPKILDENFAEFLGMYFADGNCLKAETEGTLQFTEKDSDRNRLVFDKLTSIFGDRVSVNGFNFTIHSKQLVEFFENLGIGLKGKSKQIPDVIYQSNHNVIISFIKGMSFDTHGFNDSQFIFTFESKEQMFSFAKLLKYFGIFADSRFDGKGFPKLYITSEDAVRYRDLVGFSEPKKTKKSSLFLTQKDARGKEDKVPSYLGKFILNDVWSRSLNKLSTTAVYKALKICYKKSLHYSRHKLILYLESVTKYNANSDVDCSFIDGFLNLLKNNRFAKIIEKQKCMLDAFDVEVEDGLFIADGILTHNSNIGAMGYADQWVPTGGQAVKFFSSVRIELKRMNQVKDGETTIGHLMAGKVIKNKLAPPFGSCTYEITYGENSVKLNEIIELGSKFGFINKGGSWYTFGENKLQGTAKVKAFLNENPDVANDLEEKIREKLKNG